jgi:hypothetical protein
VQVTVRPPTEKVRLRSFSANPTAIRAGESTVLTWQVENASIVSLDHGIGPVEACGSVTVRPQTSTEYKLTYQNDGGTLHKTALVTVR